MGSNICFAIVMALYTMNRCHSQELTLTKLQRSDDKLLELCFEKGGVELGSVKYYQLVIIDTKADPVVERPVINEEENVDASTTCVTFANSEMQDYAGKKGIYFILTGRKQDGTEVVFGTAQLDMPCFPENGKDSVTAYFVGSDDDKSLRINDHTRPASGSWTVTYIGASDDLECLYPTDGLKESELVPCFVIGGFQDVEGKSMLMCLKVDNQLPEGDKLTICGKEFKPTVLDNKGPSLTQASLDYSVPKLNLTANPQYNANEMDVVLYEGANHKIYVKQELSFSQNLDEHTPNFKKYNVLLVGVDGTKVKESSLTYFQDFKVHVQDLSSGSHILEVQWKKTTDVDKYSLTRSTLSSGDGGSFNQTTVNCPGGAETFCYGYFVELSAGDYEVTFMPFKKDGKEENPNNIIVSKSAKITNGIKTKEIILNTVNITWNLQDEAVVILCFHHSEDSSYTEYGYEAIIVNTEGQWQRDTMFLPAEKGILCSLGITLPSDQFKRHSVLTGTVVKRHPNGFDIIQSGHVTFELS